MKTDRELLVLAAKAAGIDATGWIDKSHEWFQGEGVAYNNEDDCQQCWNPLTGDGDALRLAVKLGLPLDFANSYYFTEGPLTKCGQQHSDDGMVPFIEVHGRDADAATRRAIVRAAAAIGEQMP